MSKQTAVEWLQEQLECFGNKHELQMSWVTVDELFDQAKEMEKEQVMNSWVSGVTSDGNMTAEQYYNEQYVSKESNDHIGDANEMIASVQKLIDKDIFNQATLAMEEIYGSGCDAEIDAYFRGAKWMQEELKQQE